MIRFIENMNFLTYAAITTAMGIANALLILAALTPLTFILSVVNGMFIALTGINSLRMGMGVSIAGGFGFYITALFLTVYVLS